MKIILGSCTLTIQIILTTLSQFLKNNQWIFILCIITILGILLINIYKNRKLYIRKNNIENLFDDSGLKRNPYKYHRYDILTPLYSIVMLILFWFIIAAL